MEVLNSKPPPSNGCLISNGHKSLGVDHRSNSVSPGSASGRSSTSSLNKCGGDQVTLRGTSAHRRDQRDLSVQFRKVSINEPPKQQQQRDSVINTINSTSSSTGFSGHRGSLIQVSAERKARKVRFFINGDKFFKGAVIAVSSEKFRTFGKLLEHLTRIMCNQVTLPNGVRVIFSMEGKQVTEVGELSHGENYLCSSGAIFKKMDYLKMAQEQDSNHWNRIKRDTYYLGMPSYKMGTLRRDAYKLSGHSKSFGAKSASVENNSDTPRITIKPKIIAVLRSGMKPRRAVRVLLNNRNTKSFETILADLTNLVKLDTGAVRKVFTLSGKPVVNVADFAEEEVFIAYGVDKCSAEDFDLDVIEFRGVQAILKSPELDAKYEKYSSASPKTSRKKFLNSRLPAKRRKPSRSRPQQPQSPREVPTRNGSGLGVLSDLQEDLSHPTDVTGKFAVGEIIGDGNFAIVKRCVCKRTKREFALKIIDKSKCLGKEHMIESEISILNIVAHPYIIELVEVFDFVDEKYLVTEYVPGGDLFDAIAVDTKYTESVSRRMVHDLTSALKYLHDKMIVHRDIKPENLLVVDLPDNVKSLKLGDFGLAQIVTEPLFTVCGTPTYVAPEILSETGYGVKVDIWATGVIMYILLCGFPPFSSRTNNQEELFDQILSGLFEFNSPDWDEVSYPAKELISWMLQVDPLQRFSAYEILEHSWLKS